MKKYRLYIKRYDIVSNTYIHEKKEILTNDIYHEIGYIYCNSIADIKQIDYEEVSIDGKK